MEQFVLELAAPPAATFASFVAGDNGPALYALRRIAGGALAHHAVYLWGPAGVGRTHLLHAVVTAAVAAQRTAHYIDAPLLESSMQLGAELIAIDNADRLSAAGEQAIFEWFNRSGPRHDSMLVAADRSPAALAARDDVRSRLASGIVFEVLPLSDEEKFAAMQAYASARGLPPLDEVFRYLLVHAGRDMGTLISLIETLDRYTLSLKRPPTLPLVHQLLQQLRIPNPVHGTDPV
ncbi:MAG: DnaA regulatory inactivator Hda [Betaproteobacteria bacterium]|nr:DnaA regulatory inactivator Hda [Betaproteobacteria bacterium]